MFGHHGRDMRLVVLDTPNRHSPSLAERFGQPRGRVVGVQIASQHVHLRPVEPHQVIRSARMFLRGQGGVEIAEVLADH